MVERQPDQIRDEFTRVIAPVGNMIDEQFKTLRQTFAPILGEV